MASGQAAHGEKPPDRPSPSGARPQYRGRVYDQRTAEVPPPPPAPGPATGHETTTTERGSFCTARCGCGWAGPARRSRDRARTDAQEHHATAG